MIGMIGLPWMFLAGLLSAAALVGIYLFRSRYRKYVVSSLMFWADQLQPITGGRRIERFRMPLIFLLELLVILLLSFAAVRPMMPREREVQRVLVVLDDSVSMRAGGQDSPRSQALRTLKMEFPGNGNSMLRFLTAGSSVRSIREPEKNFSQWKCASPEAKLEDGIALAEEMDPEAKVLVVSDHPPKDFEENGRLRWWSFGGPKDNVGIVMASREPAESKDRFLVELMRSGSKNDQTSLSISSGDKLIQRLKVEFDGRQNRRLIFDLPKSADDVRLSLPTDAMPDDNEVVLLARENRTVRIENRLADSSLRKSVERAIDAGPAHRFVSDRPDLILTEKSLADVSTSAWTMRFITGGEPRAYVGPFVVNRNHPLLEGMDFAGVIWAIGESTKPTGSVLIAAGNVPLLTDRERTSGGHTLSLFLQPEKSNLLTSPDWPILFWNLLAWRAANLPGLGEVNLRLGEPAMMTLPEETKMLTLIKPSGGKQELWPQARSLEIETDEPGIYHIKNAERDYRFAVNLLSRGESNLINSQTARLGRWAESISIQRNYQSLAWIFLLLSLAALAAHQVFITGRGTESGGRTK